MTGGENIYPAEVENVDHGAPRRAGGRRHRHPVRALGRDAARRRGDPAGRDASRAEDVIAFTRERLAHYKCPTSVEVVEALPRNPSGKVLKRELRAPHWQGRERTIS